MASGLVHVLLSHSLPSERDRVVALGGTVVCARCLGQVIGLAAGSAAFCLPLPRGQALVWLVLVPFGNELHWLGGALYMWHASPTGRAFFGVTWGLAWMGLAAVLGLGPTFVIAAMHLLLISALIYLARNAIAARVMRLDKFATRVIRLLR